MVFLSNLLVDSRPCGSDTPIALPLLVEDGAPGPVDAVGAVGETDNSKYKSLYDSQTVMMEKAGFHRNTVLDRILCMLFVLSY